MNIGLGSGNDTLNIQSIGAFTVVNAGAGTTRSTWEAWRRMQAGR